MTNVRLYRSALGNPAVTVTTKARLYRAEIASAPTNVGPIVSVSPTTFVLDAGEVLTLVGVDSDADGTVVSRGWSLNGSLLTNQATWQILAPPLLVEEVRTYSYSATDDEGVTSTATAQVTISRADWWVKNADGSRTALVLHQGPWTRPVLNNSTAMPVGNLAGGWTQIYTEDFLTPVAEGGFVPLTSGDKGMFTADNPYATKFKGKSIDEIPSYEPTTRYDSNATLSVVNNIAGTNGVLRNRIQKRADGTVRAGAMKPLFGNGVDFSTPTKIRWRARAYGGPGHSYVYDFIASNIDWMNGGGELGFWENSVAYTQANVFYRPKTATTTGDYTGTKQQFQAPGVNHQDWNIMDAEWIPGVSLILSVNGVVFYIDNNPSTVWTAPQRWVMQSGASFTNAVIGNDGFVECDWVTVWTKP